MTADYTGACCAGSHFAETSKGVRPGVVLVNYAWKNAVRDVGG